MLLLLICLLYFATVSSFDEINATVAICAVVKAEEPYIDEWIAYNIGIGFDHIFIFDNSDDISLRKTLLSPDSPSSKYYPKYITLFSAPGEEKQMKTYQDFTEEYREYHLWAAFIDVDEFIVLHKHDNIKQLLYEATRPFDFHGALSLNWVLFGSNDHKDYINEPVTKRFTRRSKDLQEHVKTIAYLPDILPMDKFPNPHFPYLSEPNLRYDCDGNILYGIMNKNYKTKQPTVTVDENGEQHFSDTVSDSMAVIHHYFTKSEAEFRAKIERGRADIKERRTWKEFDTHNFNEVEDTSAFERYCKIVGTEQCGATLG